MTDRPGALGLVASRMGAVRADIVSVSVIGQGDGWVLDEFVLSLPDDPPGLADFLVEEIEHVDGVHVESHHELVSQSSRSTSIVWFELLVDDCDVAGRFYAEALGWRVEPVGPFGDSVYYVVFPDDDPVPAGGLVQSDRAPQGSEAAGAVVYLDTADLDTTLASFEAAGGSVRSVTREEHHSSAVVADLWGNRLGLWQR